MISRLDDRLHARVKARATATNRSINDIVIEALTAVLDEGSSRHAVRDRARAMDILVVPETPTHTSLAERVIVAGSGDSVSSALTEERTAR